MTGLLTEIYEQPDALHHTLDALPAQLERFAPYAAQLRDGKLRRVVLTGMGSSFWAAYPALIALGERNITAVVLEASELLHYHNGLFDDQTLVIAVSQSGRSVEVLKLLDLLKSLGQRSPVIGVTNDPESPLAKQSTAALIFKAGEELTVSTKTYTCTLAALHLLASTLRGDPLDPELSELRQIADGIGKMLPQWGEQTKAIVGQISPVQFIVYLGRGPSRASAMTGALITKETAKLPTEGMVGGQFRHGPMEVIAPEVTTILFSNPGPTQELNVTLARDLAAREGHVIVIGTQVPGALNLTTPPAREMLAPIAEIVPVQLIAAQLAAQRGLEVGKFRFGQKVTTTE